MEMLPFNSFPTSQRDNSRFAHRINRNPDQTFQLRVHLCQLDIFRKEMNQNSDPWRPSIA